MQQRRDGETSIIRCNFSSVTLAFQPHFYFTITVIFHYRLKLSSTRVIGLPMYLSTYISIYLEGVVFRKFPGFPKIHTPQPLFTRGARVISNFLLLRDVHVHIQRSDWIIRGIVKSSLDAGIISFTGTHLLKRYIVPNWHDSFFFFSTRWPSIRVAHRLRRSAGTREHRHQSQVRGVWPAAPALSRLVLVQRWRLHRHYQRLRNRRE